MLLHININIYALYGILNIFVLKLTGRYFAAVASTVITCINKNLMILVEKKIQNLIVNETEQKREILIQYIMRILTKTKILIWMMKID